MTASVVGRLVLVGGAWTARADPRSVARRMGRAAAGQGLAATLLTADEECWVRSAAEGWDARLVATTSMGDLLGAAAGLQPSASVVLADGPDVAPVTAKLAAALGVAAPTPDAVANCLDPRAARNTLAGDGVPIGYSSGSDPVYVLQALDGEIVGSAQEVRGPGPTWGYDCPGDHDRHGGRVLRNRAVAALRALRVTDGPAQVRLALAGRDVGVIEVLPGVIDAVIATLFQLTTGFELIGAVIAASATGSSAAVRPPRWSPRRHASIRFGPEAIGGDSQTLGCGAPDPGSAAALGIPGLVATLPDADGFVLTVAEERATAANAAVVAAARVLGATRSAAMISGGQR